MHSSLFKLAVASFVLIQPSAAAPHQHNSDLAGLIRGSHLAERSQQVLSTLLFAPALSSVGENLTLDKYPMTDGECSPLPPGTGPNITPDTPEDFQKSDIWEEIAEDAETPEGYYLMFGNLDAIVDSGNELLAVLILNTYDTLSCAIACDEIDGCESFNIAVIRSPSLYVDGEQCPNPPSVSRYACGLLGEALIEDPPTDDGVWWADFHIVAAGSNVYNKVNATEAEDLEDSEDPEYPDDGDEDNNKTKAALSRRDCNGAPIIRNGGFEQDDPSRTTTPTSWNITNIHPAVTFGFTKPGSTNNGGTYAFLANMLAPDPSVEDPMTGFILSQELNTCAGHNYTVILDFRYDDPADGNCTAVVLIDPQVDGKKYPLLPCPVAKHEPHKWNTVGLDWTSTTPNDLLSLVFQCHGHVWNNWSIDNVVVDMTDS
ncbi:uncharacterized protein KY384_006334 [Bacidia gigantensis]|uniref:uncharacterized protein n=1 Tax=Bacidia gigantensis TaxID=2732470 RepID=UPI001D04ABD8|nr:uncharacterized protein KY384_006334 [Bacidia gigantensis]KAG8528647.1 hypothetical protein KY384_006334 [Bacidia gigantensis]